MNALKKFRKAAPKRGGRTDGSGLHRMQPAAEMLISRPWPAALEMKVPAWTRTQGEKHPIRVLHVIKTLALGGAETNLYNLVRVMDRSIENHVAYSYGGEIEQRFRDSGVRLFRYAEKDHKIASPASAAIIARLAAYILREKIDVVHTHVFNAQVWGGVAAKLTGRKVVEHVHDFRYLDPEEFQRRLGANRQYRHVRHFQGLTDRALVLTRQNRDFLVNNGYRSDDEVRVLSNGIPILSLNAVRAAREAVRERFGIDERDRVVFTSARIAPEKNMELILKTVPAVIESDPRALFVVSGDGPLLAECRARAQEPRYRNRLRFIGYQQDIYALLSVSQVFWLPSYLELHSISILEAMNAGVPLLVSRGVGCNDEFLTDGQNAFLRDPFRSEGWDEALIRLLKDPELRRRLGSEARWTCVERFDIRKTAEAIEEIYAELVHQ